jgi:hypothetical protein
MYSEIKNAYKNLFENSNINMHHGEVRCAVGRLGTVMGPVAEFYKCCNEPFGYIEWASS